MAKGMRMSAFVGLATIALCAILTTLPAYAAVGRTQGNLQISPSGSATYSIPLFTAPGPHGVQPSVALVYDSNAGFGYIGKGWSLAGFSSIHHCGKTIHQDGVAMPLSQSGNVLCINGNRMRLQSGTYGGWTGSSWVYDNTVWATEIADFSRITSVGNGTGGPIYWTVKQKDGLTYTYGGSSDSRVPGYQSGGQWSTRQWMISEISDRNGNKVKFTWKTPDTTTVRMTHPVKIEWTQTSAGSGSYVYSMEFNYTAGGNNDASTVTAYEDRTLKMESDILEDISIKVSGTVKRKYVLEYETSPTTGTKRLIQVTECADSAESDCLSPTTITYQDSTPGYNTGSPALNLSGNITWADGTHDFNGDGVKDIAYSLSGTLYVRMGSKTSGYGSAINTGLTSWQIGKIFGTGTDQLLSAVSGTWYVYYWNGSSFSSTSTGITTASSSTDVLLSDYDGDGRDDMVYVAATGTTTVWYPNAWYPYVSIGTRRNTSTGGYVSFATASSYAYTFAYLSTYPYPFEYNPPPGYDFEAQLTGFELTKGGDYNGDGTDELNVQYQITACYYYSPGGPQVWCGGIMGDALMAGTGWIYDFDAYSPFYWGSNITSSDINGDGCDDYNLNGDWYPNPGGYVLSSCNNVTMGTEYNDGTLGGGAYYSVGVADWNGDGLKDFILSNGSNTALYVRPLLGNQDLGTMTSSVVSFSGACQLVVTDGNGDGREDIGCLNPGYGLTMYYSNATDIPDLVAQIKDGFDVEQNISYASIADGPYTAYTNATYPLRDVTGGHIVVSSVEATDGAGGTFTTDYSYFGGARHLERRTFQGFDKIESVDSRNGIKTVRKYERAFPYEGMQIEESLYQPGNTLISTRTVTPATTTLDSTSHNERYFPYPASSTEDVYEVGGSSNGAWITHTAVSNTFDSWGNLTASTKTVTDKDSYSPWYTYSWIQSTSATISPNTTYWCLGLPTATSVTSSTTTGEASVTQSKSFSPDYANCRMDGETVEPSSSTLRVDTAYGYDGFGNVNSVAVTGKKPDTSSMTTRTSILSYGTTGQFPVSVTNALSQTTTRTVDTTFGTLLTETDPNGIVVTTNTYDSFGRPNRTTLADGTATEYIYYSCAAISACTNGDVTYTTSNLDRTVVRSISRDSSNAEMHNEWQHLDMFGRVIITNSQLLSGGYNRVSQVYDSLGRVSKVTPPCDHSSCTQYWTTNTYDLLGRLSTQTRPFSDSNSTPVTTTFAYAGRTQTITDPYSKVTTKVLDVNGWMRQSKDHDNYYQTFSYDGAGSLKQVTDSLSNTLFTANYSYGIKPFQTSTTDMDLGSWSYSYNSLGELVGWSDAKSQSFSQTYDPLSRVTSRTESEGTTTWTWGTSAGSHNIGQLAGVSMTSSSYSEALSYDSVGRLSTRSINAESTGNDAGSAYAIDYTYNNLGLPDTVTYPTSTSSTRVKVKYGYAYGLLQTVTDWTSGSAGTVYWTANTQGLGGQVTQDTLGNGVVTNRSFDAVTGWLNSIQSAVGGGTGLQNQSYAYDAIGHVTQRQENTLGLTENFYYDNLYRMTSSQVNSNTAVTYAYDAMGNITSRSDVNGGNTWTYHGTKKHAVATTGSGGASYSYDNNGNMTSRDGATIGWSSYNYPIYLTKGTETSQFEYGPDRQYYKQVYTDTGASVAETTYYIGGLLERVDDGSTIDWRHNIIANGQTVAVVSRKSTSVNAVNYMLEDHQGSGSTLTNSSGTLLARESFNAFGLPRDGADWDGAVPSGDQATINAVSRRGYTGHSMLGAMGLIHMNGRVQDAITGRFLSPDPTIPDAGFTQSYNRYAYVNNNPLTFIDPSGFTPGSAPGAGMSTEQLAGRLDYLRNIYGMMCGGSAAFGNCDAIRSDLNYWGGQFDQWSSFDQLTEYANYVLDQFPYVAEFSWTMGDDVIKGNGPDKALGRLAGHIFVSGDQKRGYRISIDGTYTFDDSVTKGQARAYVTDIEKFWNTEEDFAGVSYSVQTALKFKGEVGFFNSPGTFHVNNCAELCGPTVAMGRSMPSKGVLMRSGIEVPGTPAHEFGHDLGLGHRTKDTPSIMNSYFDWPDRRVTGYDLNRLLQLYGP